MSGNPWASVGHSARLWPKFFAGPLLAYADPARLMPGRERELAPRRAETRVAEIEPASNATSEEE